MSTIKKVKVNKNKPTRIKLRAKGKWDKITYNTFTDWNQKLNLPDLEDYNGLNVKQEECVETTKLNFEKTILPWKFDYKNRIQDRINSCLMPDGIYYRNIKPKHIEYNFSIFGNLTIDNTTKVVSGFNTRNAIRLNNIFNLSNPWELQLKFNTPTPTTRQKLNGCIDSVDYKFPTVEFGRDGNAKFIIDISSNGSSWDIADATGTYTILSNTDYWIRYGWTGTIYYLDYSLDGETFIRDIEVSSSTAAYQAPYYMGIGNDMWSSSYQAPFLGSIDLSQTYIKINNENWWVPGFTLVPDVEANCYITEDGSKAIKTNGTGIYESVSQSSFLMPTSGCQAIPKTGTGATVSGRQVYLRRTQSFEVVAKVKISNTRNSNEWNAITLSDNCVDFGISGSSFRFYTYKGSSWYGTTSGTANATTWYWLRIFYTPTATTINGKSYSANTIYGEYSSNGTSWTTIYSTTFSSNQFFNTTSGRYATLNFFNAWLGAIDFKNCFWKVNNILVWEGTKDKFISLPGCTYDFIDNGQPTTLNVFTKGKDQAIVLTPNQQYADERLLGTIDIPEHSVYTYNNHEDSWIETPVLQKDTPYEIIVAGGGGGGSTWAGGAGAYWHGIVTPNKDIPVMITVGSGGPGNGGYSRNNDGTKGLTSSIVGEGLSISCEGGQGAIALRNGDETGALSTYTYAPVVNITDANVFEIKKSVTKRPHQNSWIGSEAQYGIGAGGDAAGSTKGQGKAGKAGECIFDNRLSTTTITTDPVDVLCSTVIETNNHDTYTSVDKTLLIPYNSHIYCTFSKEGYLPRTYELYYIKNNQNIDIKLFTGTWAGDALYYINNLSADYDGGISLCFYVNSYLAKNVAKNTVITIFEDSNGKAFKIRRGNPAYPEDDSLYILEDNTVIAYDEYEDWETIFSSNVSEYDVAFFISQETYSSSTYFEGCIFNYTTQEKFNLYGMGGLTTYTGALTVNSNIYEAVSGFSIKYLGFSNQGEYYLSNFMDPVKPNLVAYQLLLNKTVTISPTPSDATVYMREWLDPTSYEYYMNEGPYPYVETNSMTIKELSTIEYKVEREGYLTTEKIRTVKDTETINVTLIQGSLNYLAPIIDNSNFEVYEGKIRNGDISYDVSNGYSYKYITYTPQQNEILTVVANINASDNGDYRYNIFACYVGTALYQPTWAQLKAYTTDGNGQYLYNINGYVGINEYSMELQAGTTYYIHFIYAKSGNLYWDREDRGYIYGTNIDFRS